MKSFKEMIMSHLGFNREIYNALKQGGGGGTSDYNDLENKPRINNTELKGNTNLKTINKETLIGEGNISIENVLRLDVLAEDVEDINLALVLDDGG